MPFIRSSEMMRLLPLLLPLCILSSCEKESPATVRIPSSLRFDHFELPVAAYLKDQLSIADSGYIEALIHGDLIEIHHPNGFLDSTAGGQSFDQVLEGISRSVPDHGKVPPLLFSATASTKFSVIRSVIRSAATTGIYRILFLVRSDTKGTAIIRIELPTMIDSMPKIEPFFIQIDDKGQIFNGTGASRTRLDDRADDNAMENLNSQLELFSAAAKSAGIENAPCQIYVHPEASYQRMIDLLSAVRKWNLKPYFSDMEPEPIQKRIMPAPRKPTSPYRSEPHPYAPSED